MRAVELALETTTFVRVVELRDQSLDSEEIMRLQTRTAGRTVRNAVSAFASVASLSFMMSACSRITDPTPTTAAAVVPSLAREIAPLPEYALWWKMTEACSGLTRNVNEIHWYSDPGPALRVDPNSADSVVGQWIAATNSIVLVQDELRNAAVVRHEMLHALLRAGGHPRAAFRQDCAGYVNCEAACLRADGPDPLVPSSAPWISVEQLIVRQSVNPARVQLTPQGDGWFALIVEVKNPYSYPVWVRLKPFPGRPDVSATFGYATESGSHQSIVQGDSLSFGPNETKRTVFDLTVKEFMAASGTPKIRGFFNAETLPEQTLNFEN